MLAEIAVAIYSSNAVTHFNLFQFQLNQDVSDVL